MIRTVDIVISGDSRAALAAAADALAPGRRVLVVLRSGSARTRRRFRRRLCDGANAHDGQVTVMVNAEIVCVDGVDGVEAVVIRHARTGRVCAVNASAFVSCHGKATDIQRQSSGRQKPGDPIRTAAAVA